MESTDHTGPYLAPTLTGCNSSRKIAGGIPIAGPNKEFVARASKWAIKFATSLTNSTLVRLRVLMNDVKSSPANYNDFMKFRF